MTPFIWTSAGTVPSPAQRVSAQIKLLRRPGWLQLVVVPPPNGQYIPTVRYSAVQYNHSTPTGHCAALSAVGELTNMFVLGYHHSIFRCEASLWVGVSVSSVRP